MVIQTQEDKTVVKKRVLFVCTQNSARSQMAEAWLNHLYGDLFEAQSAGTEAGTLNPIVVEAMREVGIDISQKRTKEVFNLFKQGETFNYLIAVCDEASGERCPIFPGALERIAWSFSDPSRFMGSKKEKLEKMRTVRDAIKERIQTWCALMRVEVPK